MPNLSSRRRILRSLAAMAAGSAVPAAFARAGSVQARVTLLPAAAQASALAAQAPRATESVLQLAVGALSRARGKGQLAREPSTLAVVDFSRPSTEKRFWIFDLESRVLLFEEWVAHGRNSGDNYATHFSNQPESLMSSLGAYQAGQVYQGKNGYSLRLHGLEPGFNDHAYARAIVIHGASYVSAETIHAQGRLGRSFGCPAVRQAVARPLIDTLADQAFVYAFYPQPDWLAGSALIDEHARTALAHL